MSTIEEKLALHMLDQHIRQTFTHKNLWSVKNILLDKDDNVSFEYLTTIDSREGSFLVYKKMDCPLLKLYFREIEKSFLRKILVTHKGQHVP